MYKIAINKEQINTMPVVSFDGQIVIIDTLSKVKSAIATLRKYSLVGFDTETRPSFKRGVLHKMALMQISAPDICFLFRINKIGLPTHLKEYLQDETCHKVGVSLHDDWNVLHRKYDITPQGFTDVQSMVPQFHIADTGLQKVFAILFGKKISKSQQLTNWEAETLTDSQQRYAATDAWACIEIYECLVRNKFDPESSPYKIDITDEE